MSGIQRDEAVHPSKIFVKNDEANKIIGHVYHRKIKQNFSTPLR